MSNKIALVSLDFAGTVRIPGIAARDSD